MISSSISPGRFYTALAVVLVLISLPSYAAVKKAAPLLPQTDEDKFVALIQQALPSVVSIVASTTNTDGTTQIISRGTGFVVDANGLILTNRHVVSETDATYRVYFPDGRRYLGTVVGRDQLEDLALVKINGDKLPAMALADSDQVKIGQTAVAIGNTLGRYPNTVTRGIVSGIGRTITAGNDLTGQQESLDNVIQTDAEINLGNSGGPLLNSKGEAMGIDSAIEQSGRGVGFAIPINEAKKDIASYKQNGRIIRPYLGVVYLTISSDLQDELKLDYDYGALVSAGDDPTAGPAVIPGGPGDKAGIQSGDIILSVNDQLVRGQATLFQLIQRYHVGDVLSLKVYRSGTLLTIPVTLEEVPAK